MPVFFARWRDGSFSIVAADDEPDAYFQLDEIQDDPFEVWEMKRCLLHFELTNQGTFRLAEIGGDTAEEFLKKSYPRLQKALTKVVPECAIVDQSQHELDVATAKNMEKAAKFERNRLRSKPVPAAKTAAGRAMQRQMGCSGPYADFMVAAALADKLADDELKKSSKTRKKVKPVKH